jgi:hypothetical protein
MGDLIKRAARQRMAETGEPYAVARRKVIEEHARLKAEQATGPAPEAPTAAEIPG